MSDDNKDLNDDLNDMLDDAKEGAKKVADKAGELASEAKEKASELIDDAKETAKEFSEGAKEVYDSATGDNKKIIAGILGILLGGLGVHKFILGYNKEGFILLGILIISFPLMCLIIGVFTMYIPMIIGFIEGVIYLTKSDKEFYETYQVGKKPWF